MNYNPSYFIQASAGDYREPNCIGVYDYEDAHGDPEVGGIIVAISNDTDDMRGFGCYFKNIPNEVNDFDGYYAVAIDDNNENTFMHHSFDTQASDRKFGTVVITVDGKSIRLYIAELKDWDGNAITPYGGMNLGELKLKVPLYVNEDISSGEKDAGALGTNILFDVIDNFLRMHNPTLDSEILFENKTNTFSVKLGDKSGLYKILDISNLSISTEGISTVQSAYGDGDIITNSKAEPRDIEIELEPDPKRIDIAIQNAFSELYKKEAYIHWKTTRWFDDWYTKDWKIHGIINEIDAPRFEDKVSIDLLLHCSNPFWQGEAVLRHFWEGGQVELSQTVPNAYFFRTKSQKTGIYLSLSTGGVMGSVGNLPKRSNFEIALYTYANLNDMTGRSMLQKMKFSGTYGQSHYQDSGHTIVDGVNYFIVISSRFREKTAVELIENKKMIDDMSRDSEFFTIGKEVCEIDFKDVFSSDLAAWNPSASMTYIPLFIG